MERSERNLTTSHPVCYCTCVVLAAFYCRRRGGIHYRRYLSAGVCVRTRARQYLSRAGACVLGAHLRAQSYGRDPDLGTTNIQYLAHPYHGLVWVPNFVLSQNNPQNFSLGSHHCSWSVWVATLEFVQQIPHNFHTLEFAYSLHILVLTHTPSPFLVFVFVIGFVLAPVAFTCCGGS